MALSQKHPDVYLLFTGAGSPLSEARVARSLALEAGWNAEKILWEELSTSTFENAAQAVALLKARQLPLRVVVVTDSWHLLRCTLVFRRFFAHVQPWGAPAPSFWRGSLREVGVLPLYALRGWLHWHSRPSPQFALRLAAGSLVQATRGWTPPGEVKPPPPPKPPRPEPGWRAKEWKRMLDEGVYASQSELARGEGVTAAAVSRGLQKLRGVIMVLLYLAACGVQPAAPADPSQDVRGLYALTWSDEFIIEANVAGATQRETVSGTETVTFEGPDGEPLELDLATFCADEAVTCPSEVWATSVAVDQDDPEVVADVHAIHVWDAEAPSTRRDGLVNHDNRDFLVGLDGDSGGSGDCGALSLSLGGGTFRYEVADTAVAPGAGPVGIDDGRVAMGWLGARAWSGLAVTATLTIETSFTGERTGDLPPAGDTGA